MPDLQKSFYEEVVTAGQGVLALIVGDRRAPQHFDFSDRGLVGSFIGLLLVTFLSAVLPLVLPGAGEDYSIARSVGIAVLLFSFQVGFAALVLRQMKRLDGLRPYLVADNWASVYISVGQLLLSFVGFQGELAFFALSILVIVVEINIARLIVTLTPLQIAMFMIAQVVGVAIALLLVGMLFPSPETQAALSSLQM
ncbi:MAG TPA: hypothetical protein VIN06_05140 [Devosia sp.]